MRNEELCQTCQSRKDCLLIPKGCVFQPTASLEAAFNDLKQALQLRGMLNTEKVISFYGNWEPDEVKQLRAFCKEHECRLGKLGYDHDFILTIDRKAKVAKDIFKEYGFRFYLMYNTRFHEDWSLLSIDEDLIRLRTDKMSNLQSHTMDLFYNTYRELIYQLFGVFDPEKFKNDVMLEFEEGTKELQAIEINSDS